MEVVGGVASVAGLAAFGLQLVNSIWKIREFYRNVQGAPAELEELLGYLDHVGDILSQFDGEEMSQTDASVHKDILQSSWNLCKKAVDSVTAVASKLEQQMQKRKPVGAVKMVLKKNEVEKILQKLNRSKDNLHLAHSMYLGAKQNHQLGQMSNKLDSIFRHLEQERDNRSQYVQYVQAIPVQAPQPNDIEDEGDQTPKHLAKRKRGMYRSYTSVTKIKIRLPYWLCEYAWDAAFEHASGRWTWSLESFRILPRDHEAWTMCEKGDVNGILRLLDNRQISIHDRNPGGMTLVEIAVYYLQLDVVKLLLDSGANACYQFHSFGILGLYALTFPNPEAPVREPFLLSQSREYAQFFASRMDLREPIDSECQILSKKPSSWTSHERLLLLDGRPWADPTDWITEILGAGCVDSEIFFGKSPHGQWALHVIAREWKWCHRKNRSPQHALGRFLERGIRAGADLHVLDASGRTPFHRVLEGRYSVTSDGAMSSWLNALAQAGIDFDQYGRVERRLWGEYLQRFWRMQNWEGMWSFTFGPQVSDWRGWFRHPGDVFAGIFWDMVEHPERAMPGAWATVNDSDLFPSHYDWS